MKRMLSVLLAVILLVSMAACGQAPAEQETEEPAAEMEEKSDLPKVAYLWCTMSAPSVQAASVAAHREADAQGVELIELDGEMNAQKQADQIANAITQGCDVIVLNPIDAKSLIPACQKAKEAGVFLIIQGMQLDESAADLVDCFVGCDDLEVGVQCGKMMMDALPDGGKVAIVEGAAGSDPQIKRTQGFEQSTEGSNIEIVDKQTSPWSTEDAMSIAEDFLIKYPDLAGFFVHDDSMAAGVIEAVKAAGKIGDIKIISYNGNKIGCEAVKNGEIAATALQDMDFSGAQPVKVAVDWYQGKEVEKAYYDNIVPITKENVDEFDPQW